MDCYIYEGSNVIILWQINQTRRFQIKHLEVLDSLNQSPSFASVLDFFSSHGLFIPYKMIILAGTPVVK